MASLPFKLKVVTGYVPIANHPRSAKEYGEFGEKTFAGLSVPVVPYYETLSECWLWKHVHSLRCPTTHSIADNPAKNTLAYMCVIHQKFAWMLKAAIKDPSVDTLVWIDYGIGHIGVTKEIIEDFLARVRPDDFAAPGCLPRENALINDFFPCWRFCGGLMIVPRKRVHKLYKAVKRNVLQHLAETQNVSWEVNTLARIEATIDLRWYMADHDETMFTNY